MFCDVFDSYNDISDPHTHSFPITSLAIHFPGKVQSASDPGHEGVLFRSPHECPLAERLCKLKCLLKILCHPPAGMKGVISVLSKWRKGQQVAKQNDPGLQPTPYS